MIDAKTLSKCIDNLAEINASVNDNSIKRLILEVGYILKQELDNVNAWNAQFGKNSKDVPIDVHKLIEDNTQLFNENKKLNELNMKLKEVIDEKIPRVEHAISGINTRFETLSEVLSKA